MNTQTDNTQADIAENNSVEQEEHIPTIDELNLELQDIFRETASRCGVTI